MAPDARGGCRGTNRDGSPCSAQPQRGRPWCVWHDPQLVERRAEWSRRGGHGKSNKARARKGLAGEAMSMRELHGLLSKAARDLVDGKLDPGPANALANIARSLEAVARTAELEAKVSGLERGAS